MSKVKDIETLKDVYADVIMVLFLGYDNSYYISDAAMGWNAVEWLLKHGEHIPTLYKENTLEMLLQQVKQEHKMIVNREGK